MNYDLDVYANLADKPERDPFAVKTDRVLIVSFDSAHGKTAHTFRFSSGLFSDSRALQLALSQFDPTDNYTVDYRSLDFAPTNHYGENYYVVVTEYDERYYYADNAEHAISQSHDAFPDQTVYECYVDRSDDEY